MQNNTAVPRHSNPQVTGRSKIVDSDNLLLEEAKVTAEKLSKTLNILT